MDAAPASASTPQSTGPRSEGQRLLLAVPYSLSHVARVIGCSKALAGYWRQGVKTPSEGFRRKFAETYGIGPDLWGLEAAAADAPAEVTVPDVPAGFLARSPGTLGLVEAELDEIHRQRASAVGKKVLPGERARITDTVTKLLALKSRLERDAELVDDRVVREHPMWRRIRDAMRDALRPFPDAARAVAKALEALEA